MKLTKKRRIMSGINNNAWLAIFKPNNRKISGASFEILSLSFSTKRAVRDTSLYRIAVLSSYRETPSVVQRVRRLISTKSH